MKTRIFKWYQIVGYAIDDSTKANPFTYLVESESPHNVLKLHGGRRRCETADGKWVLVQFPIREKDVKLMPNWTAADMYLLGSLGEAGLPETFGSSASLEAHGITGSAGSPGLAGPTASLGAVDPSGLAGPSGSVGSPAAAGSPVTSGSTGVTKVIPVTKYVCTCGREHFSEHPYRSVWCQCGHKAFPVTQPWMQQAGQHPPGGTHPGL